MRTDLIPAWLIVGALGLAVLLGVGGALSADSATGSLASDDRAAVLRTIRKGQSAILRDRPATVCRLLTRRARRNSLIAVGLDRDRRGRPRPRPKTCVDAIGYQIDDARAAGELKHLRVHGVLRTTRIVRIQGKRAHVRKGKPGNLGDIYLLKRKDGWRADYANFSPFDGTTGE